MTKKLLPKSKISPRSCAKGAIPARFSFVAESKVFSALKSFHRAAGAAMVSTPRLKSELESQGFTNLVLWSRGLDMARSA